VEYNNRIWLISGMDVWSSQDGVSWTCATDSAFDPKRGPSAVVKDNKMWLLGGWSIETDFESWYSTDGAHWVEASATTAPWGRKSHASVVHNDRMWVLGGYLPSGFCNDVWSSAGFGGIGDAPVVGRMGPVCRLECNPNPVGRSTRITYSLPGETDVALAVYNAAGEIVTLLVKNRQRPGDYTVRWDVNGMSGARLPAGTYFCRIEAGEYVATRKMVTTE
jgi:hypothetical protein